METHCNNADNNLPVMSYGDSAKKTEYDIH